MNISLCMIISAGSLSLDSLVLKLIIVIVWHPE